MFTNKSCPQLAHPHFWSTSRDGDSTCSLSSLFQSFQWRNFFLLSSLNFCWHTLKQFCLVLSLVTWRTDWPSPGCCSCRKQWAPPWASFSPGWISQRSLSDNFLCGACLPPPNQSSSNNFHYFVFMLLWNNKNPCLWEKSILEQQ